METTRFEVADFLDDAEHIVAYLNVVLEDGDYSELIEALGDVARSKGMTELAEKTGLDRSNLYQALSKDGNPKAETIFKILQAFGIKLHLATT